MIEFDGRISPSGESAGHYTCDVKESVTNMWYRTNDNSDPIHIRVSDVTQNGYVVLYKRA